MKQTCLEFKHDPIIFDDDIENIVNNKRKVGIEIETETLDRGEWYSDPNDKNWNLVVDGSLLDSGSELVSVPIPRGELLKYLRELERFEDSIFREASVRTSVHIHVDCSRLDFLNVVMGWILIEPYIMRIYMERYNNLFCSTWNGFSSEFLGSYLFDSISFSDFLYASKYKSLSLYRYTDFKTVEYRFLPLLSCLNDIALWADFLSAFTDSAARKTYSQTDVNKFVIIDRCSDFIEAMSTVFGKDVCEKIVRILNGTGNFNDDFFKSANRFFNSTDVFMTFEMIARSTKSGDDYV